MTRFRMMIVPTVLFLFLLPSKLARADETDLSLIQPLPNAHAKPGNYKLDFRIVEVKEQTDVKSLAIRFFHKKLEQGSSHGELIHSFTKLNCADCHTLKDADIKQPSELLWKALLENRNAMETWVSDSKDVSVLSSPTIIVEPDRKAIVDVKSKQSFDYLERRKDGLFELKQKTLETGISIHATVKTVADNDQRVRLEPVTVSVAAIKQREEIEGVNLPAVGMPVLTKTSIDTSLLTQLGESQIISIDSPKGGRVLIAVKITCVTNADAADNK